MLKTFRWCFFLALTLGACGAAAVRPTGAAAAFRPVSPVAGGNLGWVPAPKELELDDLYPIAGLAPLEGGPGILVCEPVLGDGNGDTGAFGNGCSRWLQLMVGGHGELGRTPLWRQVDSARRRMKKSDLRMSAADLAGLRLHLGITHAALGTIRQEGNRCTLSYQLHALPSGEAVEPPIRLSGMRDEVVAALPSAAATLLKQLGVVTPRLPPGVGETASELTALGQIAWAPEQDSPDTYFEILNGARDLTTGKNGGDARPVRPVLGCFLALSWARAVNSAVVPKAIEALRPQLPGNTLALAEISQQLYLSQARTRLNFELPEAAELLRKYPQNQALWAAQSFLYRLPKRDLSIARRAAEMQTRACRENPEAWILLGDTIAHQFARIRQGRPIEEQSEAEQEACQELLMEEMLVRLKTIELSPAHPVGWMQVSHCAARLGQDLDALEAFERALELDPNEYTLLGWGIQLFSPRWFSNPPKLLEIADQAVKVGKSWRIAYRVQMYWVLQQAGLPDRAEKLVLRETERFRFEEARPMP